MNDFRMRFSEAGARERRTGRTTVGPPRGSGVSRWFGRGGQGSWVRRCGAGAWAGGRSRDGLVAGGCVESASPDRSIETAAITRRGLQGDRRAEREQVVALQLARRRDDSGVVHAGTGGLRARDGMAGVCQTHRQMHAALGIVAARHVEMDVQQRGQTLEDREAHEHHHDAPHAATRPRMAGADGRCVRERSWVR